MKQLLSSITLLLLSTLAFGQVPNTFSSGETISSSKINANFAFLAAAIENDEIKAMMVCETSGIANQDKSKYYYGWCSSTDNTTFGSGTKELLYFKGGGQKDYVYPENYISIEDLFTNKWILYYSSMSRGDNYQMQNHVFYKVSSD